MLVSVSDALSGCLDDLQVHEVLVDHLMTASRQHAVTSAVAAAAAAVAAAPSCRTTVATSA